MRKICLLSIAVVLALLCAMSIGFALIPWEESDRDPDTGYSSPPGTSWSYAWMYALYNPKTQTYTGHQFDHDIGIGNIFDGLYMYVPSDSASQTHPHCWTQMYYRLNTSYEWSLDTFAQVSW